MAGSSSKRGKRVRPPPAVAACLERIFNQPVETVEVIEHSWLVRLHGRATATTRPGRIYLRGSAQALFGDPWLMLHEYFHVLEQWKPRRLTRSRYLLESLRRGYWNNRFEVEACDFADRHASHLLDLLRATDPHFQAAVPTRRRRAARRPPR